MNNQPGPKFVVQARAILSQDQVRHVAKLAGLKLTEREVTKFQKQLSQILGYINQLKELDTEKVEPTNQVTGLENVFREDEPQPSLSQEEVLSGAKKKFKGFFKTESIF